jgi:hypothetical protein
VDHPLYPLYHVIARTGLRRGEGCGQRRSDTRLDAASLEVANQIVQYGWEAFSRPEACGPFGMARNIAARPGTWFMNGHWPSLWKKSLAVVFTLRKRSAM